MKRHALLTVATLAACIGPDDDADRSVPSQLEAIRTTVTVDHQPWGLDSTSRRERLTIEGSGQDYTIRTDDLVVQLHSPGHNDITSMTDRTGSLNVAPTLSAEWPRSLVITSNTGWAYIADVGNDAQVVEAALYRRAVDFGEELGTVEEDDTWEVTYYDLIVHADDEDVRMTAGDSQTVIFNAEIWRVTAIAAYIREPLDGAELPDCPIETEVLSYEMLKVPEATAPKAFTRPTGTEAASLDCEG